MLSRYYGLLKVVLFPFILFYKFLSLVFWNKDENNIEAQNIDIGESQETDISDSVKDSDKIPLKFIPKLSSEAYEVDINIICAGEDPIEVRSSIKEVASTL